MYALGVPVTVTVDDVIPLDDNGHAVFADVGPDQALWPLVLEKCFAKLSGNYEAIVAGNAEASIRALNGSPAELIEHTASMADGSATNAIDTLWSEITATIAAQGMVSASTPGSSNSGRTESNLAQNHVYTVLDSFVAESNGQRLLRIRNPWGREYYDGPYADNDTANWDAALQAQVSYVDDNDGTFFIDLNTYINEFEYTQTHIDTTNLHQTYHLVIDDQSTNMSGTRVEHTFEITSAVDQTIYVGANTWPKRSYPSDCSPGEDMHVVFFGWKSSGTIFRQEYQSSYQISAGETQTVEFLADWGDSSTRDFSIVVWGDVEKATLTVTSPETQQVSSELPFTERQASSGNAAQEATADECFQNPVIAETYNYITEITNDTGKGGLRYVCEGSGPTFGFYGWNLSVDVKFPSEYWDDIIMSDKTVIIDDGTDNGDGTVTKTFGLLTNDANGYDRFALHIPKFLDYECNNTNLNSIVDDIAYLNADNYNIEDYNVFNNPAPPADCTPEYTDGSNIDDNTEDNQRA